MKKPPLALALTAITLGSAHADNLVYSSEDFEGGTPNYTITGVAAPYTLTQLQDGGVGIPSTTALTGTDYTPGSPSRCGVFANNDIPGTIVNEPSGQHGFVSQSQNRQLRLTNPMTLVTDGVSTLNITFDTLLDAFDDGVQSPDFDDTGAVFYSALGDFTDAVMIATFATVNMAEPTVYPALPTSVLGHTTLVEDTWSTINLVLTPSDVAFTDTAKIRFNKLPSTGTNLMIFFDNIAITGIPGSIPDAPFVVTITPAVDPNTGYDLQWTSQTGMTYSVLTSTDLAGPVDSWKVVQADIAPTLQQNSYNVPADGPRRFYAIMETPTP